MKIRLLWVGKTKEPWIAEGIEKYMALLRPMAQVSVVEVKEERGKTSGSRDALEKEAERILRQAGSRFILLDEQGRGMDSPGLARMLAERLEGQADVDFVIGGPYGVARRVKEAADQRIALSPMTFTHQMARVILLEQVYRALMIKNRRSYHN